MWKQQILLGGVGGGRKGRRNGNVSTPSHLTVFISLLLVSLSIEEGFTLPLVGSAQNNRRRRAGPLSISPACTDHEASLSHCSQSHDDLAISVDSVVFLFSLFNPTKERSKYSTAKTN